jgi:hypothetical protein
MFGEHLKFAQKINVYSWGNYIHLTLEMTHFQSTESVLLS